MHWMHGIDYFAANRSMPSVATLWIQLVSVAKVWLAIKTRIWCRRSKYLFPWLLPAPALLPPLPPPVFRQFVAHFLRAFSYLKVIKCILTAHNRQPARAGPISGCCLHPSTPSPSPATIYSFSSAAACAATCSWCLMDAVVVVVPVLVGLLLLVLSFCFWGH